MKSAPSIQNDIQKRIVNSLHSAGYDSINVEVKGRDVVLSGSVNDGKLRAVIEQIVNVDGVRMIENHIVVDSHSDFSDYFLEVEKKSDSLNVKGFISDAISHHHFIVYIMEAFSTTAINDQLTERSSPPEKWTTTIKSGLNALKQLDTGNLKITETELTLAGNISSIELQKKVINDLNTSLPDFINVIEHLSIVSPSTSAIKNKTEQQLNQSKTIKEPIQ